MKKNSLSLSGCRKKGYSEGVEKLKFTVGRVKFDINLAKLIVCEKICLSSLNILKFLKSYLCFIRKITGTSQSLPFLPEVRNGE